jgi:peptidoglycan hydrolase-like protein with peptidoglycan-binding domain
MIKKYLSFLLFILMIILIGYTIENKDSEPAKLTSTDSVLKINNVTVTSNKIYLTNQFKSVKSGTQNKLKVSIKTSYKRGDKGSKVKEIQRKLNKFGYKLYVDGDFGRLTYNAVIDFQMRNKIAKDGIVGNLTFKKLDLEPTPATMYKPTVKKNLKLNFQKMR